jgi:methionyl aminopeptidase
MVLVITKTHRSRGPQVSEQLKKRAPLVRGTVSPALTVPRHIPLPPYVGSKKMPEIASEMQMHDKETIVHMRAACELAARVLENAGKLVKVCMHFQLIVSSP